MPRDGATRDPLEDLDELNRGATAKPLFRLLTVDDIEAMPEPEWLVPELIIEKSLFCIYGPPKSLKSFMVLDLLLRLALGMEWRGINLEPQNVLYISFEGTAGMKARIEAWKRHNGITGPIPRFRMISEPLRLVDEEDVRRLVRS